MNWRFILARTSNLEVIDELPARSRQLNLTLNRPGSASFNIPLDHRLAWDVEELSTTLIAVRNGSVMWSGPIWTTDVNANDNKLGITAVGWIEELHHRIVRGPYVNTLGASIATQEQTWTNTDASIIARGLVTKANQQQDMNGVARPTHIALPGVFDSSQIRTRNYTKNQNIGDAIKELSDVEAGFDYYVDPVTRDFHVVYDQVIVDPAVTIRGIGSDRRDIVLAYRWGPANLSGAGYTSDSARMCNRMVAAGPQGQGIAEDTDSMNATGFMFEESASLMEVTDPSLLLAYAGAEVATRAYPPRVYNVQPFPFTGTNSVPEPFVDFGLGDIVSLSAQSGAWTEDKKAVRIFGMTFDIDDNGNERISSLQTAAGG